MAGTMWALNLLRQLQVRMPLPSIHRVIIAQVRRIGGVGHAETQPRDAATPDALPPRHNGTLAVGSGGGAEGGTAGCAADDRQ